MKQLFVIILLVFFSCLLTYAQCGQCITKPCSCEEAKADIALAEQWIKIRETDLEWDDCPKSSQKAYLACHNAELKDLKKYRNILGALTKKYKGCLIPPPPPPLPTCANNDINRDHFLNYHPCGIAISKMGKVAITTYEGDQTDGQIFIWNNFSDFNNNQCPNYQYAVKDPEGIAFDNNETLFIADTYHGKIIYTTDISKAPTSFFYISGDANGNNHKDWNPRGIAVDANNNLYVMCENLSPVSPSRIIKVQNPTNNNITKTPLTTNFPLRENALGLCNYVEVLFYTDFFNKNITQYYINQYATDTNPLTWTDEKGYNPLDITFDGRNIFYTNTGGYLVKKERIPNIDTKGTQSIFIALNANYVPWGIAIYNNFIIVADAAENKVKVIEKDTKDWQPY